MSRLLAGRLAHAGAIGDGWVAIAGETIEQSGFGALPRMPDERIDGVLAPGLLDLQVNGAAGVQVGDGHAALDRIEAELLRRGVTSYLPTVISSPDATAEAIVATLAERIADPTSPAIGVHLEGPYLSTEHPGAHDPEHLRTPAAGPRAPALSSPAVRLVTLAPELEGALALIAELRARGITVAIGHTGADAATATAALDTGATLVTHVFNAMAPLHHRAPGPAGVALADARAHVGVIADGLHVDPIVLELIRRAAGERVVLVSDASAAAAAPAGSYRLGATDIALDPVRGARTRDGSLAGSAILLDDAMRGWTRLTAATPAEALHAATAAPAEAIGLGDPLLPGAPADLVELDENLTVLRVMRRGRWLG